MIALIAKEGYQFMIDLIYILIPIIFFDKMKKLGEVRFKFIIG